MKSNLAEFIDNARKRRVDKFRNQFSVFLICLGISLFLWLLVRLSKEYNLSMKYKLEFRGVPRGLKLAGVSDSLLDLNLRIQGFEYFSEQYFKPEKRSLKINLRNIMIKQSEDNIKGFILTKNLYRSIAEQTSYSVELFSISPDTIFFHFERKGHNNKIPSSSTRTIEIKPARDSIRIKDSLLLLKNKNNVWKQ